MTHSLGGDDMLFHRNLQNCTLDNCSEESSSGSAPLFKGFHANEHFALIVALVTTFVISFVKICFFDIPRNRRNSQNAEKNRKKFIESRIIRKTVIKAPTGPQADTDEEKNTEPQTIAQRKKTDLYLYCMESQEMHCSSLELECLVCCEEFEEKDEICWSKNPQCNHAFHIQCIEPWFMQHDECPVCRNNYLATSEEICCDETCAVTESQSSLPSMNVSLVCSLADKFRGAWGRRHSGEGNIRNDSFANSQDISVFESEYGADELPAAQVLDDDSDEEFPSDQALEDIDEESPSAQAPGDVIDEESPSAQPPGDDAVEVSPCVQVPGDNIDQESPTTQPPGDDIDEESPSVQTPGDSIDEECPAAPRENPASSGDQVFQDVECQNEVE
eukprot:scaffold25665_cov113-Cylindrotheca_fusiformis.AAC.6